VCLILLQGGDLDAKSKSLKKGSREMREIDFAQPVDPQKLNKALTNLQVRLVVNSLIARQFALQVLDAP
jgi:hypothetical protein